MIKTQFFKKRFLLAEVAIIALIAIFLFFSLNVVYAEEKKSKEIVPKSQVKIPGLEFTPVTFTEEGEAEVPWIGQYISAIYKWSLTAIAIVAVIMIMIGGLMWMLAGGNETRISQAKKRMQDAVIGLLLLVFLHTILSLINPDLVVFKPLAIKVIKGKELALQEENLDRKAYGCFFEKFGRTEEKVKKQLVNVNILGKSYPVHKKAKDAFEKVAAAISSSPDSNVKNYKITEEASGTFNWRCQMTLKKIEPSPKPPECKGGRAMSIHSWGLAIDINPKRNPFEKRKEGKACTKDIPDEVIKIFKDNGFEWGGEFSSCDTMHFQWRGGSSYCGGDLKKQFFCEKDEIPMPEFSRCGEEPYKKCQELCGKESVHCQLRGVITCCVCK